MTAQFKITKVTVAHLVVEVIKVPRDKNVNVPHDLQNVQTLISTHRRDSELTNSNFCFSH